MRLSRTVSLLMAILLAATLSEAFVVAVAGDQAVGRRTRLPRSPSTTCGAGTEVGNTNHFVVVGTR